MLVEGISNNEDVTAVLGSSWLEIDVVWATNEDETPVAPEESGKAVQMIAALIQTLLN